MHREVNFNDALSYLLALGHETLTIKLGLANTERLLDALGNPQESFPAVQIAGTNGKGSTAAMLDSICRAAAIRTGLFTSPHLISITERIKVNGESISEDDFAKLTDEVKQTSEGLVACGVLQTLPTFFEQVTAIALLAFRQAKVELAILETGLGGRLDSTTAARADVVGITQIAMDHEEYLGHTIAEIAAEKAAIIRSGVMAVIAPQTEAARDVILARCATVKVAPLLVQSPTGNRPSDCDYRLSDLTADGRARATFKTPQTVYQDVLIGLRGRHQVENACMAIALAEALRQKNFGISDKNIIQGLERVNHPGRLELWSSTPAILFDGAHNPASALALREYLDEFVPQPITMIFGAMKDKHLDVMAAVLFPRARHLILTEIDNPRAAALQTLQDLISRQTQPVEVHTAASVAEALATARQTTAADGLICVTGSLYLVGALQQLSDTGLRSFAQRDDPH